MRSWRLRDNERRHHLVGAGSDQDHDRHHQQRRNGVPPARNALMPPSADQYLGMLLHNASPFGIRRQIVCSLTNRVIFIHLGRKHCRNRTCRSGARTGLAFCSLSLHRDLPRFVPEPESNPPPPSVDRSLADPTQQKWLQCKISGPDLRSHDALSARTLLAPFGNAAGNLPEVAVLENR